MKQSFERPVGCGDKRYVLVQKSSLHNNKGITAAYTSIKPTKSCPFKLASLDVDSKRIPKVIPKFVCPAHICSSSCKKLAVSWTVLQKKSNSKRYTVNYVDVVIGYIE